MNVFNQTPRCYLGIYLFFGQNMKEIVQLQIAMYVKFVIISPPPKGMKKNKDGNIRKQYLNYYRLTWLQIITMTINYGNFVGNITLELIESTPH